jgi:hypothetical protein
MSLASHNREVKRKRLEMDKIVYIMLKKISGGVKLDKLDLSELGEIERKRVIKYYNSKIFKGFEF